MAAEPTPATEAAATSETHPEKEGVSLKPDVLAHIGKFTITNARNGYSKSYTAR